MPRKAKFDPPPETAALRKQLQEALGSKDEQGRVVSEAQHGVYLFYDYDGEPIYVGQTYEGLRTRIRRHLTNQRTDAVAMNVLDPFEVAEIEMWPLWELAGSEKSEAKQLLNRAEYAVYQKAVGSLEHGAILNEGDVPPTEPMDLPVSLRIRIVPDGIFEDRRHPDTRIARRASTIAALAACDQRAEVKRVSGAHS